MYINLQPHYLVSLYMLYYIKTIHLAPISIFTDKNIMNYIYYINMTYVLSTSHYTTKYLYLLKKVCGK